MDDALYINVVMTIYGLIEYSDTYLKTTGSLQRYYREEPALGNNGNIIDFQVITIKVFHSNLKRNNRANKQQPNTRF